MNICAESVKEAFDCLVTYALDPEFDPTYDPAELLGRWMLDDILAAGFHVGDVATALNIGVAEVIRWRDSGIPPEKIDGEQLEWLANIAWRWELHGFLKPVLHPWWVRAQGGGRAPKWEFVKRPWWVYELIGKLLADLQSARYRVGRPTVRPYLVVT